MSESLNVKYIFLGIEFLPQSHISLQHDGLNL